MREISKTQMLVSFLLAEVKSAVQRKAHKRSQLILLPLLRSFCFKGSNISHCSQLFIFALCRLQICPPPPKKKLEMLIITEVTEDCFISSWSIL